MKTKNNKTARAPRASVATVSTPTTAVENNPIATLIAKIKSLVNLGHKRVLVYPLGHTATIGDSTRIAVASKNATQFVTLTGTTDNGKKLTATDSNGTEITVNFSHIGTLAISDANGKLSEITIKDWQRISNVYFDRATA